VHRSCRLQDQARETNRAPYPKLGGFLQVLSPILIAATRLRSSKADSGLVLLLALTRPPGCSTHPIHLLVIAIE